MSSTGFFSSLFSFSIRLRRISTGGTIEEYFNERREYKD